MVSVLVCTRGVVLELDWWNFLWGGGGGVSRYYITHISLLAAYTARTDMVYSKELERDVTTTALVKALVRLKTLASIPS